MSEKLCKKCGGIYPKEFFYSTGNSGGMHTSTWKRRICEGCRTTRQDQKKRESRFRDKARSTRKRHAIKLDYTAEELRMMGWEIGNTAQGMIHDCKHAYENNCIECGFPYNGMGHGLADITLDITNPELEPHYPSNARWICATCNRRKGALPLSIWMIKKKCWKMWEERSGPCQLTLFNTNVIM